MPLKEYLMIPGPTPVPPQVISAMARPMINHRGPEFARLFGEILEGLAWAFQTKNEIMVLPSSGTGGMEAAIVNVLSPGDRVLIGNIGAFGSRFTKIAKAYGLEVDEIKVERGKALDPGLVAEKLAADKNKVIKAVLFQQNETSTGVLNDVKAIAALAKKHGALTVVDAISGLLTAEFLTDEWGLDVVISGAQKAFMIPPGLAFVSVSPRAWTAGEAAKLPRFYWDFRLIRQFQEKCQNPVTPPVSVLYGLRESLKMLKEEGLPNIAARHRKLRDAVRAGVRALGLSPLAEDAVASPAVTGAAPPAGIDSDTVRKIMREKYGVVLAGGQEDLKGKIFRIGHVGYIDNLEILGTFSALELTFNELGQKIEFGRAAAAVEREIS